MVYGVGRHENTIIIQTFKQEYKSINPPFERFKNYHSTYNPNKKNIIFRSHTSFYKCTHFSFDNMLKRVSRAAIMAITVNERHNSDTLSSTHRVLYMFLFVSNLAQYHPSYYVSNHSDPCLNVLSSRLVFEVSAASSSFPGCRESAGNSRVTRYSALQIYREIQKKQHKKGHNSVI